MKKLLLLVVAVVALALPASASAYSTWTIGGVSIMEGLTVGEEYEGDFSWTAGNPAYSVYQCKVKLTIYAENEGGKQKAWIQGFDRSIENCFGTNGYSSCVNVGMTNDFLAGSELTLGKSETIDVVSPSGYVELKDVFQTPGSCPATGKAAKWNNGSLKIYPTVDGSGTITQVVLDGSTTQGIVNFTFGPLKRVSSFPYALGIK